MSSTYLLPGERDPSSSTPLSHHGLLQSPGQYLAPIRIYEPKENDTVIGIVLVRTPDLFLVEINSAEAAILPLTSFDNGRLPARHAMNRLSVVLARVVRTDRWTQTELSCQTFRRNSEFGLINDGNILRCSLSLGEKLQRGALFNRLTQSNAEFRFRPTRNGFVWYRAPTSQSMIAVKNVIAQHEYENRLDVLIENYQLWIKRVEQQDEQLAHVKQKTKLPPAKKKEPVENNAMTRLLESVVRDVLDNLISQIEKTQL